MSDRQQDGDGRSLSEETNPSPRNHLETPPPAMIMGQMIGGFMITQALHVAARLRLADRIHHQPRTARVLAQELAVDPDALSRLLRMLASQGVFVSETSVQRTDNTHLDRIYQSNALSDLLRSDVPSMYNFALWAGLECTWRPFGDLLRSVETGQPAVPRIFGHGIDDHLADDADAAAVFSRVMTERTMPTAQALAATYDFSSSQRIVDVGGGMGHLLAVILQANPHARGILFDLPEVIEQAGKHLTDEPVSQRIELVAGSFWDDVPVSGDTFVLSNILHDWDDEHALEILRHCREAIDDQGRLLVLEYVIVPGDEPHPAKFSDLIMLITAGGRERTEGDFFSLFEKAGFELMNVTPLPTGVCLIEGAIRETG